MGVGTLRFHRGNVAAKAAKAVATPAPIVEAAPVVESAAPAAQAVVEPRVTAPSGPVKTATAAPKTHVEHRRR